MNTKKICLWAFGKELKNINSTDVIESFFDRNPSCKSTGSLALDFMLIGYLYAQHEVRSKRAEYHRNYRNKNREKIRQHAKKYSQKEEAKEKNRQYQRKLYVKKKNENGISDNIKVKTS